MRQARFKFEQTSDGQGILWSVHVSWENGAGQNQNITRSLGRVGQGGKAFPLPPTEEAAALPRNTPEEEVIYNFCNDHTGQTLTKALASIQERVVGQKRVYCFGRYLFLTVLGDALWARILGDVRPEGDLVTPLHLVFDWANNEPLDRLPWEMLCGPQGFLAQLPEVAFTRCVPVAPGSPAPSPLASFPTPPRVLFVVGSPLNTDGLRPGAEYLNLLRGLRAAGNDMALRSYLLLNANRDNLREAVLTFRPTVIHFICHGKLQGAQEPKLKMRNPKGDGEEWYGADSLLIQMAQPDGTLPQVVVLSACFSGNTGASQNGPAATSPFLPTTEVNAPLAARLVRGGIPLVIGMGGAIADQACRLFTRTFYEALLGQCSLLQNNGIGAPDGAGTAGGATSQEGVTLSVARGRRAGILGGSGNAAADSVDWSLPMLFASEAAVRDSTRINVLRDNQHTAWWTAVSNVTREYGVDRGCPVFCDRISLFHEFDVLMLERYAGNANARPVLVIRTDEATTAAAAQAASASTLGIRAPDPCDAKLGASWLLKNLTVHAIREGHIPVPFIRTEVDEWPKTARELFFGLQQAAEASADLMGLKTGNAPWAAKNLGNALAQAPLDGNSGVDTLAAALREDLMNLLQVARQTWPVNDGETRRLVLLIDDVHLMSDAAKTLLYHVIGSNSNMTGRMGLRGAFDDIRVVLAYDLTTDTNHSDAIHVHIQPWIQSVTWRRLADLSPFAEGEDRMAYEYFLLHLKMADANNTPMPLSISTGADPKLVENIISMFRKNVWGIPSRLSREGRGVVKSVLDLFEGMPMPILISANDEDALKLEREQR